jgi:hypothetical protein
VSNYQSINELIFEIMKEKTNKVLLRRAKKNITMDINLSKYLPTPELAKEFEEFQKLKTEEEKKAFQEKRRKNFENKTLTEQEEFLTASKMGLDSALKRTEELIEKVELGEVANLH